MKPINGAVDFAMLVDDNEVDNYVSEQAIRQTQFAKRLKVFCSVASALEYLAIHQDNLAEVPEMIFLDMNLSDADAFTFINGFEKLKPSAKDKCRLMILSSMGDQEAMDRINENRYVMGVASKPMRHELLTELKEKVYASASLSSEA